MWIESEQNCAFSRRIARDMPRMPSIMRWCFYTLSPLSAICSVLGLILSLTCLVVISYITISVFDGVLVSANTLTPMVIPLTIMALLCLVVPCVIRFIVSTWYYKARGSWVSKSEVKLK